MYECKIAINLLEKINIKKSNILADCAYRSKEMIKYIKQNDANYVISQKNAKKAWKYDKWLYKKRHLVECFFNKLKQFRRIATRYDKLAVSFLAFVQLGAISVLLK